MEAVRVRDVEEAQQKVVWSGRSRGGEIVISRGGRLIV